MKRYGAAFLPVFSMVAVLFSTQVLYAEIPSLEPPRVVSFRINGGQEKTGNRTVTLDFVAERASQFRASERPDFSGAPWVPIPDTPPKFLLSAGDGVKTVHLQVKGLMDRVSVPVKDSITLQTSPVATPIQSAPMIPAMADPPRVTSFRISGGQEKTNNRTVTLDFVAERASQYRASERQDFSGAQWVAIPGTPPTFTLGTGDGVKTVYLQVKGTLDRVSAVASDTITLQTMPVMAPLGQSGTLTPIVTTPPRVTSFRLNNGREFTNNPTVTLDFVAERASQYRASERQDFSGAQWVAIPGAPPTFTLSTGDGVKTVYFQVKSNVAGESAIVTDSISFETTPRITSFSVTEWMGCSSCLGPELSKGIRVKIKVVASFPPDKYRISGKPDFTDADWKNWSSLAGPANEKTPWGIIPRGIGTRNVYLQVMKGDVASRNFTGTFQVPPVRTFVYDSTGEVADYAKNHGFQFGQKGDQWSACEIQNTNFTDMGGNDLVLKIPSRPLGSRCDFTLFEGRSIKDGWKFKNYLSHAECDFPGRNYAVNERPAENSRLIRFRVHMWADGGKDCSWRLDIMNLEGPGDGGSYEPFE